MDPAAIFQLRARLLGRRLAVLQHAIVNNDVDDLGWAESAFLDQIGERRKSQTQLSKKNTPDPGDWSSLQSEEKGCGRLFEEGLGFLRLKGRAQLEPSLNGLANSLVNTLAKLCKFGEPPLIIPDLVIWN